MMVNWEFMDNMTPPSPRPSSSTTCARAPRSTPPAARAIVTWRQAERVLAGFPDGLADEGPTAGPASLVGLEIARENGWTAPDTHQRGAKAQQPDSKTEAAEEADTSRAETETKAEEGQKSD